MQWFLTLLGGFGVGSLLTTIVNHFLAKKSEAAEKRYQEKREAYIGMTRALYDSEIEPGPKNEKMFGYYLNVAKIFGTKKVVIAAQKVIESKPHSQERDFALNEFYEAMKTDLNN